MTTTPISLAIPRALRTMAAALACLALSALACDRANAQGCREQSILLPSRSWAAISDGQGTTVFFQRHVHRRQHRCHIVIRFPNGRYQHFDQALPLDVPGQFRLELRHGTAIQTGINGVNSVGLKFKPTLVVCTNRWRLH